MSSKIILISSTVPDTLTAILRRQPRYLNDFFEVKLVTSPGASSGSIEKVEGIAPNFVPMVRGISPLRDMVSIVRMMVLLRKIKPDLVHSYTPKAGLVSMLAAFFCRVPVRVHTFTGLIFPTQKGIKQRVLVWVDRLICACATVVVPEGGGVKKDLQRFRVTRKPLEVIGFGNIAGVSTDFFSRSNPQLVGRGAGFDFSCSENFVFCFVGRLNKDKGIKELVSAFARLPDNARLVILGGVDEAAPVDEKTMRLLTKDSRVHLLGFQTDIRPVLSKSHVLVLPSYREGFPNVVLQAGSMELPVIATDINGCNEVVEPGCNGWLVPAKDADALYQAMQQAMKTPPEALAAMGRHARKRIRERFEQRDHWQRMVEFYKQQLGEV